MEEVEEQNCARTSHFLSWATVYGFDTALPLPVARTVPLVCQTDAFTRD